MKIINCSSLLKWKNGKNKDCVNWSENVGCIIKFQYDDIEGEVKIVDYIKEKQKLILKYLDKEPFEIATSDFLNCSLGKLLGKITSDFKVKINTQFKDEKRDIIIIDKKYKINEKDGITYKYYKYKCNICKYEDWIVESGLLGKHKQGCSCCAGRTVIPGINDIPTTAPWMVKYFVNPEEAKLYTKTSHEKITFKCPICNKIKNKTMKISTLYNYGIACPFCSDGKSYPEKFMFSLLEQLNIDFETEYSPEWIKYLYKDKLRQGRYDFLFELDKNKYIVETDGGWHKTNNNMTGQSSKESKEIDNCKDILANEHGIKVIRIDCCQSELEYIKSSILNSYLSNLFDLSKVNWNECHKHACSSLVKIASEIKQSNPDLTTTEIGKIMNIKSKTTIRNYLKKGMKLGWCDYNALEESIKTKSKNGKKCGKPVYVYKDGKLMCSVPFKSTHDLERQSEELFGIKLNQGKISAVCLGKKPQYKGFVFKYDLIELEEVVR